MRQAGPCLSAAIDQARISTVRVNPACDTGRRLKVSYCRGNRMHLPSQLQKHFPFVKGSIRDIFESPPAGANRA
ncbi:MAG: hypothetical protein C0510_06915 [Erythrobacter sp.]|nr:hypothetical protein [Erythrobacter sp.]